MGMAWWCFDSESESCSSALTLLVAHKLFSVFLSTKRCSQREAEQIGEDRLVYCSSATVYHEQAGWPFCLQATVFIYSHVK